MAVEVWMLTAAANLVMVFVYAWIALLMLRGLNAGHQWTTNLIATSTAAIFITCTFGHGLHLAHVMLPAVFGHHTEAARIAMGDPRLLAWDLFTAGVAIYYFTLRGRLDLLFRGAALCEDLERRQQQAKELHDNVVQGLVRAKLAFDMGDRAEGERAVRSTLESAKSIITGLLGRDVAPGDLRRREASH